MYLYVNLLTSWHIASSPSHLPFDWQVLTSGPPSTNAPQEAFTVVPGGYPRPTLCLLYSSSAFDVRKGQVSARIFTHISDIFLRDLLPPFVLHFSAMSYSI